MLSSSHILALAFYFPLLALGSPIVSSRNSFPSSLPDQTLRLVRENAIKISTHRSVCLHPADSCPSGYTLAVAAIDE
jgi:hypothetical protein